MLQATIKLLARVADSGNSSVSWQAHQALQALWDDIHTDDTRARQGMGLSEHPSVLPADELELLNEYMATH